MSPHTLIPAIEMRLGTFKELQRRQRLEDMARIKEQQANPTITISREFGCEAYPVAERLQELLEKQTGQPWVIMDKALLEEVANNHNISENLLNQLGNKAGFLDEIMATLTPHWKTEKDIFRLLCSHIFTLAAEGNVIFVGRGAAHITQPLENCHHFRLYASRDFKIRSIARRLYISDEEAEKIVVQRQKQRDKFMHDFLNRESSDLSVFDLIFNNDRNSTEKIAHTIMEYVLKD